jgi:hypothetical protein
LRFSPQDVCCSLKLETIFMNLFVLLTSGNWVFSNSGFTHRSIVLTWFLSDRPIVQLHRCWFVKFLVNNLLIKMFI